MKYIKAALVVMFVSVLSLPAMASSAQDLLVHLQDRWVEVNYQTPEKTRSAAFEALSKEAEQALGQYPNSAELLIWSGIIQSSWAGAAGGLGALDLVKSAKAKLEQAISINPKALNGSAYTSLGALYYQVPGWPLSFGDDKKAEELLKQALAINPEGIDPNYFYGDFLMDQKQYGEARKVFEKALKAPDRPGRAKADAFRREEIRQHLAQF